MNLRELIARDHDRLLEILRNYSETRNKEVARAETLLDEFKAAIQRHIAWKEELLLPLIESRTGLHMPGPSAPIRAQHRRIQELLEKISPEVDPKSAEETERKLMDQLLLHSQEEERVLYPWIDTCLCQEEKEKAIDRIESTYNHESRDAA